jgi:hypothetical protein
MTSRTITILNAAIAVVTVTAVTLDLQSRHRDHVRATSAARPSSRANGLSKDRPHLYNDVIDVRVDKLSSVPPSELYEVLMQATPEEIAALALKFNNLPPDGPSIGSVGMFFQAWAEIDGLAALEGAFRINDLQLKRMAAGTVIGSVSPALCADIAARLRNNPDPALLTESRGTYLDMLLERWAFVDGPASAKFARRSPMGPRAASATHGPRSIPTPRSIGSSSSEKIRRSMG